MAGRRCNPGVMCREAVLHLGGGGRGRGRPSRTRAGPHRTCRARNISPYRGCCAAALSPTAVSAARTVSRRCLCPLRSVSTHVPDLPQQDKPAIGALADSCRGTSGQNAVMKYVFRLSAAPETSHGRVSLSSRVVFWALRISQSPLRRPYISCGLCRALHARVRIACAGGDGGRRADGPPRRWRALRARAAPVG